MTIIDLIAQESPEERTWEETEKLMQATINYGE
jgi:hypothetical protein